ncbi:hypothetical protein FHX42_002471 [Saccharopolyspora lacisalsi]|uniref:Uncharacterized protein n=1 Tax=Halosaccharopolyspora lacisalsi TaxID=1000566 RepID=A0A839DW47_9PSEU|nr:hypothetical protein [Halosaccharopolyspora lacisalsi]MBA8825120.1 hypothetical protein [Halosaccharopolyspora lacisalsi]
MTYEAERQAQKRARDRNRDPAKLWTRIIAFPALVGCFLVLRFLQPAGALSWAVITLGLLALFPAGFTLSEWSGQRARSSPWGILRGTCIIVGITFMFLYALFTVIYILAD